MTGHRTCPSSITPARSTTRSSFSADWSQTRSRAAGINLSCGIAEKQLAMSVSTTRRRPPALVNEHLQDIVRRPRAPWWCAAGSVNLTV